MLCVRCIYTSRRCLDLKKRYIWVGSAHYNERMKNYALLRDKYRLSILKVYPNHNWHPNRLWPSNTLHFSLRSTQGHLKVFSVEDSLSYASRNSSWSFLTLASVSMTCSKLPSAMINDHKRGGPFKEDMLL